MGIQLISIHANRRCPQLKEAACEVSKCHHVEGAAVLVVDSDLHTNPFLDPLGSFLRHWSPLGGQAAAMACMDLAMAWELVCNCRLDFAKYSFGEDMKGNTNVPVVV